MSLIFEEETYVIRSAGCGFLEAVYAVIEKYGLSACALTFSAFRVFRGYKQPVGLRNETQQLGYAAIMEHELCGF